MPLPRPRLALPTRPLRRVALELVAAALWPLTMLGIVFLPAAPFTAVLVAEVERWRAKVCDEDTFPLHPERHAPAWAARRIRTRALWRSDVPIALVSLVLGPVALLIGTFGLLGGGALALAPAFVAGNVSLGIGSWVIDSASEAWAAIPLGVFILITAGVLLLGISVARDALVRTLGGQEAHRLTRELGSVRMSRARMLETFDEERRRIERDLHDGAQQDLVALSITLGMLEHATRELHGSGNDRARDLARRAHEQAERSLLRLRETVHGIHPRELSDLGFLAALGTLADRSPMRVELCGYGDDTRLPALVAGALYFVVAESLTNVSVHSGVDRAVVVVDVASTVVSVTVRDEGCGGARMDTSGTGLAGLRERVRTLGGELVVESPDGGGTTVLATAPITTPEITSGMMRA